MKNKFLSVVLVLILLICTACNKAQSTFECTHCGETISVESKFCANCGTKINVDIESTTETLNQEQSCTHVWIEATIYAPKTCSKCGMTSGSPLKKCLLCDNIPSRETTLYCDTHDCMIYDCSYPAKSDGRGGRGSHCAYHGCYVPDCLSIPIGGTNHCASH